MVLLAQFYRGSCLVCKGKSAAGPSRRSAASLPRIQSRSEKSGRLFCFPVQQTASLSGAGAVVGRSFFLKTRRGDKFPREEDIGTFVAYLCIQK
jgi:hypothetical protein